jgi:hypothetical protein
MNKLVHTFKKNVSIEHVTSIVIAVVSSLVLLVYYCVDPKRKAEAYYRDTGSPWTYRTMEACYIVILAALMFNMRFVLSDVSIKMILSFIPVATKKRFMKMIGRTYKK